METKLNPETERLLNAAHDWVLLMEDPAVTGLDRTAFEAWLDADPRHADAYDRAITVRAAFQSLSKNDIDADLHYRPDWRAKITEMIAPVFATWRYRIALGGGFAAILAAFVILPDLTVGSGPDPASPPLRADYESGIGETMTMTLADGTQVTLGARTVISTRFYDDRRVVDLKAGVAYFNVAHDENRPFSVKAAALTATAVGTAFDVKRSAGIYRVAVAEGTVQVRYPFTFNGNTTLKTTLKTLNAGQQVVATQTDGLRDVSRVDVANVAAWQRGRFIYSGASVAEFVADLNRYSTLPIVIDDPADSLTDLKVQGVFRGRDVDRLLVSLTEIHPIDIDRSDPSRVILRSR